MNSNKELNLKIISIASLVVLGYIFFISVYNQIIVQSGGVFYVIIFGGILILAFVLLSLVTKLIEITGEIRDNIMWNFVEILLLCNLSYLFLVFRMAYKSSVPGEETVLFRAASLMSEGALAEKGMDMVNHLCIYPSQYLYSVVLSIFFRIGGASTNTLVVFNAITIILTAFLINRVVRKIAGRACGIIAAMCTVFIPSQSFAVYSYSSEAFLCVLILLCIDLWLILLETDGQDKKKQMILSGLFGLSCALLCFAEPLMIICVIAFIVYFVIKTIKDGNDPKIMAGIACAAVILLLIIFTVIKSASLGTGFGTVASGAMSRFKLSEKMDTGEKYTFGELFKRFHENLDNQNTNVKDNYHFLTNDEGETYTQTHNAWFSLGTQMSYMFALVMSIACAFYMFRNKFEEAVPVFLVLLSNFIVLLFRSTDEDTTFYMFEILIIVACCGLNYMYKNHHPELFGLITEEAPLEEAVEEPKTSIDGAMEWGAIARARKLIFVKNDDEDLSDLQMEDQGIPSADTTGAAGQAPAAAMPEPVPAPAKVPTPVEETGEMMGGSVSPEGYFSFFNLAPAPGAVNPAPAPVPVAVPESEEYTEAVEEYTEEAEEYTGPIEEVEEVEEYTGMGFDMPSDGYVDSYGEYPQDEGGYDEGAVYAGEAEEYAEPVEEYTEPVEEYTEPVEEYSESVEEYSEPMEEYTEYTGSMEEYAEPVEEYAETAEEYTEAADGGYGEDAGYENGYGEPSFDELAQEYGSEEEYSPAGEYSAGGGYAKEDDYTGTNAGGNTTKASFTSAAHALGFSLSDDFFSNVEPAYEEPAYEEPSYEETSYEEPSYDEPPVQEYTEDEDYEELPAYDPTYEAGVDDFSFGEGMPDISPDEPVYEEPAYEEPVYQEQVYEEPVYTEPEPVPVPEPVAQPAPVPKKKVVKKKVVRRVVKKAARPQLPTMELKDDLSGIKEQFEPEEDLPTMELKNDLSGIEEAFLYEDDYVDDDAIYDEPAGGESTHGFVIEI